LSGGVGVELSDDDVCPILPDGISIGEKTSPITFSLVEDSTSANFIFTNLSPDKTTRHKYKLQSVETKGFLDEKLELSAIITDDQIAKIEIINKTFGSNTEQGRKSIELNKLNFYYNISALDAL